MDFLYSIYRILPIDIPMIESTKKRQANFLITVQTLKLLKDKVPNRKQSEFVEQAVVKELKKSQFLEAIQTSRGAWKNHTEDTEKFIRSMRASKRI